jgi:AraC-like DNA-binding protein
MRKLRGDVAALLDASGIDPKALDDPDGAIPFARMGALWMHAAKSFADEFIGIHIAESLPLDSLDIHTYAMRASPTLREALRIAVKFQRLIHETTVLEFDETKGREALRHRFPGGGAVPRQPAEFLVTLWVRLAREVVPTAWKPLSVRFAHTPLQNTDEYHRVFGDNIEFGSSQTELFFPENVLDRKNPRAEPALLGLLKRYAGTLHRFPEGSTAAERARGTLSAMWPLYPASAEEIARLLSMSVRSMNRALKAEGTSFTAIRTAVRTERAKNLLVLSDVAIAEVAFATGFSELSAFYRAFRRWYGCSPAQWRSQHLD